MKNIISKKRLSAVPMATKSRQTGMAKQNHSPPVQKNGHPRQVVPASGKKRVLFIDGNALVLKTVASMLTGSDFHCLLADNGVDGLFRLVEEKPDLVFIDSKASRINGFQLCDMLRGREAYNGISIIIMIREDDYIEQVNAGNAKADSVLLKPFGKAEILTLLDKHSEKISA